MYYFIDDEHKNNFFYLLNQYGFKMGEDGQHEASLYLTSISDIYRLISEKELARTVSARISPLFSLAEWSEEEEKYKFIHSGLTGSTTQIGKFGLSLYNGLPIGLDHIFGSVTSREYVEALIQAIRIRTRI